MFSLLKNLTLMEMTKLANIAISDNAGYAIDEADWFGDKYWEELGDLIRSLPGLRNIFTVHDIAEPLKEISRYYELLYDHLFAASLASAAFEYSLDEREDRYSLELCNDYPDELIQRFGFTNEDIEFQRLISEEFSDHRGNGDWVDERTKPIWGCRRLKHLDAVT